MTQTCTRTYIGVGSNLDNPIQNVQQAIRTLNSIGQLVACSSLYLTKPWGYTEQPDFVNAVASLDVNCSAHELLRSLLCIETEMGRERLIKWGPRIIDLDILLFGDLQVTGPALTIPHPQMHNRAFVLVPLAEINPDFVGAAKNLPAEVLQEVTRIEQVRADELCLQDIAADSGI